MTQIEEINSRPLQPYSLILISPALFLMDRMLTLIPDSEHTGVPVDCLTRYEMLHILQPHFWSRWSTEYIKELQQCQKWKQTSFSLEKGSLVLLKDDNLPPVQWKLARNTQLFPGKDNVCSVAEIADI